MSPCHECPAGPCRATQWTGGVSTALRRAVLIPARTSKAEAFFPSGRRNASSPKREFKMLLAFFTQYGYASPVLKMFQGGSREAVFFCGKGLPLSFCIPFPSWGQGSLSWKGPLHLRPFSGPSAALGVVAGKRAHARTFFAETSFRFAFTVLHGKLPRPCGLRSLERPSDTCGPTTGQGGGSAEATALF